MYDNVINIMKEIKRTSYMIKILGRILCFIGIHRWEYVTDNKVFPFIPYTYCKRCGKIKVNQ